MPNRLKSWSLAATRLSATRCCTGMHSALLRRPGHAGRHPLLASQLLRRLQSERVELLLLPYARLLRAHCLPVAEQRGLQGVLVKPLFTRGSHIFEAPIMLSAEPADARALLIAYLLPPLVTAGLRYLVVQPIRRRAKYQQVRECKTGRVGSTEHSQRYMPCCPAGHSRAALPRQRSQPQTSKVLAGRQAHAPLCLWLVPLTGSMHPMTCKRQSS